MFKNEPSNNPRRRRFRDVNWANEEEPPRFFYFQMWKPTHPHSLTIYAHKDNLKMKG